jgi:hypothetical protein
MSVIIAHEKEESKACKILVKMLVIQLKLP